MYNIFDQSRTSDPVKRKKPERISIVKYNVGVGKGMHELKV